VLACLAPWRSVAATSNRTARPGTRARGRGGRPRPVARERSLHSPNPGVEPEEGAPPAVVPSAGREQPYRPADLLRAVPGASAGGAGSVALAPLPVVERQRQAWSECSSVTLAAQERGGPQQPASEINAPFTGESLAIDRVARLCYALNATGKLPRGTKTPSPLKGLWRRCWRHQRQRRQFNWDKAKR
jgi:hypothetical protein